MKWVETWHDTIHSPTLSAGKDDTFGTRRTFSARRGGESVAGWDRGMVGSRRTVEGSEIIVGEMVGLSSGLTGFGFVKFVSFWMMEERFFLTGI